MLRYVYESWLALLPTPWAAVLLPPIAALAGGIVGTEREYREKPAGLRTMALVSLGACVFTIIGYAFTSKTGDSGRVTSQIVAGIGFLGGGMLIRGSEGVHGATTAVTVWVTAAIGMVIGAGYPAGGLALTLFVLSLLGAVGSWERGHFGGRHAERISIVFVEHGGKTRVKLERLLAMYGAQFVLSDAARIEGCTRWSLDASMSKRRFHEFLFDLAAMDDVVAIERG